MSGVLRDGNDITLLVSGEAYFPALIAAIESARTEVRLETYIYANDTTGHAVAAALIRAAARGVRVHVVVDGFGSPGFMLDFGFSLRRAGVEVLVFRPKPPRIRLRRYRLRRLHRKLVCVDRCTAFVGGINVIDDISMPSQTAPRHDYAVRITGPLVGEVLAAMQRLWLLLRWVNVGQRYAATPPQVSCAGPQGAMQAALLIRDNLGHRREIEEAYLNAIDHAQQDILIANAYFLPGRNFRQALVAAAQRGVRVTLLLQGVVEYRLQHYATQALYGQLLGAGVRIYEYQRSFMHAKVAVIDTDWATVGSSNIDPFSLFLAREANVVIRDAQFASELRTSLLSAMHEDSTEILSRAPQRWWQRTMSWIAYGLTRALVGLIGYGGRF